MLLFLSIVNAAGERTVTETDIVFTDGSNAMAADLDLGGYNVTNIDNIECSEPIGSYTYRVYVDPDNSSIYKAKHSNGTICWKATNASYVINQARTFTASENGGTICFGDGAFYIDTSIEYSENICFVGQTQSDDTGKLGTRIERLGDFPVFTPVDETVRHVAVKSLSISGAGGGVGSTGLFLMNSNVSDVFFESVCFLNSGGVGVDMDGTSYWVTMINCRGQNLAGALISKVSPDSGTLVVLQNCLTHFGGPIASLYGISGLSIEGGGGDNFNGSAYVISLCAGSIYSVDVEGGVSGTSGHGIHLTGGSMQVFGNRIYMFGDGYTYTPIYLQGDGGGSNIFGNSIQSTHAAKSIIFAGDASNFHVYNNKIDKACYGTMSSCVIGNNIGFITENSGTQICASGENIVHGLDGTPAFVQVDSMNITYDSVPVFVNVNWTAVDSTNINVGVYWTNGTAITDDSILVSWSAKYKP
jgi:hypothetical protein